MSLGYDMITKNIITQEIETHRAKIRQLGVKKIFLVGSYAQGHATESSDLDFLVEFEDGRGLFDDFVHLKQLLEDLFHKEIDLGEERLLREEIKSYIMRGKKVEANI